MPRKLLLGLLGLMLTAISGCHGSFPDSYTAQGFHLVDAQEGWQMEVCQLEGNRPAAKILVLAGDGLTAIAVSPRPRNNEKAIHADAIQVFDTATGKIIGSQSATDAELNSWSFAVSRDGRFVSSVGTDGQRRIWDLQDGPCLTDPAQQFDNAPSRALPDWVKKWGWEYEMFPDVRASLSPDGRWVIKLERNFSTCTLHDARTGQVAGRIWLADVWGDHPVWLPDSTGFDLSNPGTWQVIRIRLPKTLDKREQPLTPQLVVPSNPDAPFDGRERGISADGKVVFAGPYRWSDGKLQRLNLGFGLRAIQINEDGRFLLSQFMDRVAVYRVADMTHIDSGGDSTFEGSVRSGRKQSDQGWDFQVADGKILAAFWSGQDGCVVTSATVADVQHLTGWDLLNGQYCWELTAEPGAQYHGVWASGDGQKMVANLTRNGQSKWALYDAESKTLIRLLPIQDDRKDQPLAFAGLSRDGNVLALTHPNPGNWDGVEFFDLQRNIIISQCKVRAGERVVLSPDGTLALTRSDQDGVWNVVDTSKTGKPIGRLERPGEPIEWAAFAADGRLFTISTHEICQWAKPGPADFAGAMMPVVLQRIPSH